VHFLGALLEPLMPPLFNLPGAAAFVVAMGYTSGFPVGAVLTGRLRRSQLVTRLEGERLLSFTNNASPLFMLVAIPVGMLGFPAAGAYLATVNYATNLMVGLLFRFYGKNRPSPIAWESGLSAPMQSPLRALLEGRRSDGRPLGKLMGDAVRTATTNLMVIGGFIVFFSVLLQLLGVLGLWEGLLREMHRLLGGYLESSLVEGLGTGIWEITLGCQAVGLADAPLEIKITLIGFLLGWAGLAIHAQVASMVADTDLRLTPFVVSRVLHGALASLALYLGFRFQLLELAQPTAAVTSRLLDSPWTTSLCWSLKGMGYSLVMLLLLALGCRLQPGNLRRPQPRVKPPVIF
ncbi:MAG: sporulation integral membrane protein YlbJ, partial [Syntrophomonadaceae bacterium]|nr:sporulation integral membrane protein YlbJ [Syntrophomonadaceae bacterium]